MTEDELDELIEEIDSIHIYDPDFDIYFQDDIIEEPINDLNYES